MFKSGLCLILVATFSFSSAQITVAAAANMQFAMEELQADFQKQSGAEVKTVYGSSGKLAAQIKTGAPFDVFVSADTVFPESLVQWKAAVGRPKIYAYGALVLWTLEDLDLQKGVAVVCDSSVRKIVLPDPQTAPYGREAVKALRKAGLWDKLSAQVVYAENISQAAQYIVTRTVDVGFNAKSVVLSPEMRGKGKWVEVDRSLYDPLAQAAVVCKYGSEKNPALSARFQAYLYSRKAGDILKKYGYSLP